MKRIESIEKKISRMEKILEDCKVLKSKLHGDNLMHLEWWLKNSLNGWREGEVDLADCSRSFCL
jgi:hypothetical protein